MQHQVDRLPYGMRQFCSLTQGLRTCTQQAHTSEFAKDPHLETCLCLCLGLGRGACRVEWALSLAGWLRARACMSV